MPTYEYECQACKHRMEAFQSMKDEPLTQCPSCKKKKLKRLIGTGAGMIFKGGGFYCTDYRSSGYANAAKSDSNTSSTASSGSSAPASSPSDSAKKTSEPAKSSKKEAVA